MSREAEALERIADALERISPPAATLPETAVAAAAEPDLTRLITAVVKQL